MSRSLLSTLKRLSYDLILICFILILFPLSVLLTNLVLICFFSTLFALLTHLTKLKEDGILECNWFLVFTPMWIIYSVMLVMFLLRRIHLTWRILPTNENEIRKNEICKNELRKNTLDLIMIHTVTFYFALTCMKRQYDLSFSDGIISVPVWFAIIVRQLYAFKISDGYTMLYEYFFMIRFLVRQQCKRSRSVLG